MSAQVEELQKQLEEARLREERLTKDLQQAREAKEKLQSKAEEVGKGGDRAKGMNEDENDGQDGKTAFNSNEESSNKGEGSKSEECSGAADADGEEDHEGDVESKVQTWKGAGNACFSSGSYQEAVTHYTRCIKALEKAALPPSAPILGNRCACYLALKRFVPASWDAQCAVRADPKWWKGYWRHGVALMGMSPKNERSEMAVKAFENCRDCEGLPEDKKKDVDEALNRARVRLKEGRDRTPLPQQCQQQ